MTGTGAVMLVRPAAPDDQVRAGMDLRNPPTSRDPLGEALHALRLSGAFSCASDFTEPWGLTLPPLPGHRWFHVETSGRFALDLGDGQSTTLHSGDLALVTQGAGHRLGSDTAAPAPGILDLPREEVSDHYEVLRHGGGGALTRMMCGAVRFDHPAARNLVALLPEIIFLDATSTPDVSWMQGTLALIAAETKQPRPGGEAVITRLADVLVIQAIRSWIDTDPAAQTGWLGAMRDDAVGRALSLIHRDPARDWTVAAPSGAAGGGRPAFAR